MEKITSIQDLARIREKSMPALKTAANSRDTQAVLIKVAMATCGIASGAKDTYDYIKQEIERRNINAFITQTGCMSYCYAEPTVEITLPNQEPVVFGHVNSAKAQEIIDRYILQHEMIDGIIPASYKTIL